MTIPVDESANVKLEGRMAGLSKGITVEKMIQILELLPKDDRLVIYIKSQNAWHDVVGIYPEAMSVVNILYDTRKWR